jgi:glycerol-3-phosphate O-acyltransferase/dihydroxyacetone phosphate acyltransferase
MLVSLVRLLLSFIFVLPGNIMVFPLSTAISFYAERERIKALAGSTVKVKANDVLASIKILAYISTFPLYLFFFTVLFYKSLRWYFDAGRIDAYSYTVTFFFIFPILQFIAIRSYDGVKTHYSEF